MKKWRQIIGVFVAFLLLVGVIIYNPLISYGENNSLVTTCSDKLQGVIALQVESPLALVDNQETKLDAGSDFITPLLIEGRVLVPVRFIAESLGWSVEWAAAEEQVILKTARHEVRLGLGEKYFWLNNEKIALDLPATKYLDRTYIPLRAIGEAFGKGVHYEGKLIVIADKNVNIDFTKDSAIWEQVRQRLDILPVVGSEENLRNLLAEMSSSAPYRTGNVGNELMKQAAAESVQDTASADTAGTAYSETNLQVQGVDEADYIKTDGKYIYQVNGQKVIISQAYPAESMKVQAILNYDEASFNPRELYVDQNCLVVIGSGVDSKAYSPDAAVSSKMIMPPYYRTTKSMVIIYDIKDKNNISKIREVETDGDYVSSRKIGKALYLVTNKYLNNYRILENGTVTLPTYRDTALQDKAVEIPLTEIGCILPVAQPNYLIVTGLDLAQPAKAAQVTAYLGSGENVYVSEKNLYVAVTEYAGYYPLRDGIMPDIMPNNEEQTLVYKFGLDQGQVTYLQKGQVPGRVLNQFSMDEYQDNFRIATTVGYSWGRGTETSRNNLYVLDGSLSIIGRIEDIAPGEQIYSTRFMGERAYMVTFKTVDPLFVIGLEDPRSPHILGALKIPGYSDYLHPFGDNYLIGFGKDTVEIPYKNRQGQVLGTNAYYLGMKVALFDVTDVTKPKELFVEMIGDRGTTSELLYNHKALLFDKTSGLLSFPVSLYEVPAGDKKDRVNGMPEYGQFTFQGAYVYNLNLTNGFTLKGRISHLTGEDYQKAGYLGARSDREVKRVLYIGDTLYTLSDTQIQANDLRTLENKNSLTLP